jgi:hypothetical protein
MPLLTLILERKKEEKSLCDCCHEVILLMVVASYNRFDETEGMMKQKRLSEGDDAVLLDD